RLRRARKLPRVVRTQPAAAADREVPAGQRRAHRHAQHDRGLSARPRRLPRSDRTRDRRAGSRARDGEAASGRGVAADGDIGTPPRWRFRGSARERRAARAVPANRKSACNAVARRGCRGGDGHARREELPRAADRWRSEPHRHRGVRFRVRVLRHQGKRVELSRDTKRRLSQGTRGSGLVRTARGPRRGALADRRSAVRRAHRGRRRADRTRSRARAFDSGGGRDLSAPPILPPIETRSFARRLPIDFLVVVGLFALQAWAIAPLFTGEFTQFRGSIEATFIANARFIAGRFPDLSWYPYWYLGFPFELFYTPLLPAVVAVLGKTG